MNLGQNTDVKKKKILSIQVLRAIAILGILTSHCGATTLGAWGVSIFIILSGFVMYYSYKDKVLPNNAKESLSFSIKKLRKLYPLHILMMIAALVFALKGLIKSFTIKSLILVLTKVILNIFLLQTWVPSSNIYFSLNGVAWYLSACLFLYFMFPFLMKKIKKINSNKTALITIIVIYIIELLIGFFSSYLPQSFYLFDNISKWITYILPIFRLGDFTIGCCLCYLYLNYHNKLNRTIYTLFEILMVFAIIASEYIYRNQVGFLSSEWFKYTMLYTLSSCIIIYLFAEKKGIITNILTNKIFIYLGNISPLIFLIHKVVIMYFDKLNIKFFKISLNAWIKFILILLITILASKLYSIIEKNITFIKKEE